MLRINPIESAEKARKYYIDRKYLETYYSANQEFNGYWVGKGAEILGLKETLGAEDFCRLVENRHPKTGKRMTPRMRADREAGRDLTFDCPKSVSLLYAFSRDDRIVQAFRQAVKDTMDEMELAAATRVRSKLDKNADQNRTTGNWVAAEFIHLTARPENGYPDPHLHGHLVVMNMTFDPVEKRWKALQMRNIHDEAKYYQGAYHMRLRENLQDLGLKTVLTEDCFEIAGVLKETNRKFSRRTEKIEAMAERLGITDPKRKAELGAMTRERKNKTLLIDELQPMWWGLLDQTEKESFEGLKTVLRQSLAVELSGQMTPSASLEGLADGLGKLQRLPEVQTGDASSDALGTKKRLSNGETERRKSINQRTRPWEAVVEDVTPTEHDYRALKLAAEHLFQRKSVVSQKQLIGEAFESWCVGEATRAGIEKVAREAPLLRQEWGGRIFVTTAEVWNEEKRLTHVCQQGKGKWEPINKNWQFYDEQLNAGQRAAVRNALSSQDFVIGIAGVAGSGKTTLMRELVRGAKAGFCEPVVLAPLAATAYDTLRHDGFENAETIAKFLNSEGLQKQARGGVLLVDEAGLVSNPLADKLLQVAEKLEARVFFLGDAGQLRSIQRGQAFEHLRDSGKMSVTDVTEILRQQGPYKQFVEMYLSGERRRAVTSLWSMDAMVVQPLNELARSVATDYVAAIERGDTALAVSPTHAEGAVLTQAIREKLKEKKLLGQAVTWDILRNHGWSDAEKADLDHYKDQRGAIIQFNRQVKGFALGERVEVIDVRDDVVRVRYGPSYDSGIKKLPLHEAKKFSVYTRDKIEICEGDKIWITGNGRADNYRLNNGTQHKVDYISHDGKLVLENGRKIGKEFPHLIHGWVLTAYAAQGKTVDWVFACQTQELSDAATDAVQYHVATTRGRKGVKSYVDNFEWLKDRVTELPKRMMATELLETYRSTAQDEMLSKLERREHAPQPEVEEDAVQNSGWEMKDAPMSSKPLAKLGRTDAECTPAQDEWLCKLEKQEQAPQHEIDVQNHEWEMNDAATPSKPLAAELGRTDAPDIKPEMERPLEKIQSVEMETRNAPALTMTM